MDTTPPHPAASDRQRLELLAYLARFDDPSDRPGQHDPVRDRDLLTFAEAIGMRACFMVPLIARGRTLGAHLRACAARGARARQFSAVCRGLRLVALTGYGSEGDRAQAFASSFDEHLVKPVRTGQLFATLQRMLH
jgi:hypothetical protein